MATSPIKYSTFLKATGLFLCALTFGTVSQAETFLEALASAYESQPALLAQREQVKEIDETYVQARAAGRPTAAFDLSTGRSLTELSSAANSQTANALPRNGSFSLVQPLYQGGRVKGLKGQAKQTVLAARQDLRNVEQNILLQAANAYVDVIRDEEAARIRRNNVRVLSIQRQAAQERFNGGVGTKTEIAQAQSRLVSSRRGLSNAEADLAISRQAYLRIIGHMPEQLSAALLYELPLNLASAQLIARSNNPQLYAARFEAKAADSAISIAKSNHKPTLSLNGQLRNVEDQVTGLGDSKSAEVILQMRIPVYSGGLNKSRVRAAKSAQARLEFQARDVERAVQQAVADAWARVRASREALRSSQAQAVEAKIAFQGVELERNAGLRSTLDVLDAEQEVLTAELAILDDRRALHQSVYQLMVSMGVFDAAALRLDVDYYDPSENLNDITSRKMIRFVPKPIEKLGKQLPDIPLELAGFAVQTLTTDSMIQRLPDPAEKLVRQLPNIPRDIEERAEDIVESDFIDDYFIEPPKKIVGQIPDIIGDVVRVPVVIGTEMRDAIVSQLPEDQRIQKSNNKDEVKDNTPEKPLPGYPHWRDFKDDEDSISNFDDKLNQHSDSYEDPIQIKENTVLSDVGVITSEEGGVDESVREKQAEPPKKRRKRNRSRSR